MAEEKEHPRQLLTFERAMFPYFHRLGWNWDYANYMTAAEIKEAKDDYERRLEENQDIDEKSDAWETFRRFREARQLANAKAIVEAKAIIERKQNEMLKLAQITYMDDDDVSSDSSCCNHAWH